MNPSLSLIARVRLNLTGKIGSRLAERLRSHLGGWKEVFKASEADLTSFRGVGPVLARQILDPQMEVSARDEIAGARAAGWAIDTPGDGSYPELLAATYDPPLVLYRLGDCLSGDSRSMAIVGARWATRYGIRQASKLAEDLAAAGWTVVSGLARGIDTAAHRGALRAGGAVRSGGRTIAVLGTGLDLAYPPENRPLIREIVEGGGAVVTEFPRGSPPRRQNFPRRNRIISGLSRGTVVVEASRKSGALITARWAQEENREVFAMPGSVETGRSQGCHRLIRDGARIVEQASDVLEEFSVAAPRPDVMDGSGSGPSVGEPDGAILALLRDGEMSIDEIGEAADLRPSELAMRLLRLEMRGAVQRYPGRRFALNPRGSPRNM